MIIDRTTEKVDLVLEEGEQHQPDVKEPTKYEVLRFQTQTIALDPATVFAKSGPNYQAAEMTIAELQAEAQSRWPRAFATQRDHGHPPEVHISGGLPGVRSARGRAGGVEQQGEPPRQLRGGIGNRLRLLDPHVPGPGHGPGPLDLPASPAGFPTSSSAPASPCSCGGTGSRMPESSSRCRRQRRCSNGCARPAHARARPHRRGSRGLETLSVGAAARPEGRTAKVGGDPHPAGMGAPPRRCWTCMSRAYLRVLALAFCGMLGIFYIAAFIDWSDNLFKGQATGVQLALFLAYSTPEYVYYVLPLAALVATLVTIGLLTKSSELIVMRACGVSLYRTAVPLLIFALLWSGALFALEESVLAESTGRGSAQASDARRPAAHVQRAQPPVAHGTGRPALPLQLLRSPREGPERARGL